METNQTAVEWLAIYLKGITSLNCDEVIAKAKEMEKEHIMDAFQEGKWDWHSKLNEGKESKDPADYYNQTYGSAKK